METAIPMLEAKEMKGWGREGTGGAEGFEKVAGFNKVKECRRAGQKDPKTWVGSR